MGRQGERGGSKAANCHSTSKRLVLSDPAVRLSAVGMRRLYVAVATHMEVWKGELRKGAERK